MRRLRRRPPRRRGKGDPEPDGFFKDYRCPECPVRFTNPADLGAHVERHRPLVSPNAPPVTRWTKWRKCPKGCGRQFSGGVEFREHAEICDGQEPLVPVVWFAFWMLRR